MSETTAPPPPAVPAPAEALAARMAAVRAAVDARLDAVLGEAPLAGGPERVPPRLVAAARHGVIGGGKRFRPFLVVEGARLFGVEGQAVIDAGAAFELLHCYSLVHDDLPAMDDDDLRRGQPTVHKAYDEATAILVGDGLQTLAFEILATLPAADAVRARLVACLAAASGFAGMVGGQFLDLNPALAAEAVNAEAVARLQRMKTGALIRAACEAGAILGAADREATAGLARYGAAVGAAFQLADDLLDITGDEAVIGKRAHKDAEAGKATLAGLMGVAATRAELARLVAEAEAALAPFGERGAVLAAAARFVAERTS